MCTETFCTQASTDTLLRMFCTTGCRLFVLICIIQMFPGISCNIKAKHVLLPCCSLDSEEKEKCNVVPVRK